MGTSRAGASFEEPTNRQQYHASPQTLFLKVGLRSLEITVTFAAVSNLNSLIIFVME